MYRQALEVGQRFEQIVEVESGLVALQWCQQTLPSAIVLDFELIDLDGLQFLKALGRQSGRTRLPVVALTQQDDPKTVTQILNSGAHDYLSKSSLTTELLRRTVWNLIQQMHLFQQLEQSREQQRLIGAIALRIQRSLKLQRVLEAVVFEVRELLNADRVVVYQFAPDMNGKIVAESVLPQWSPCLEVQILDTCFQANKGGSYRQGISTAIPDIQTAGLTDCHLQMLEQFQVKANLVVPILTNEEIGSQTWTPHLWGLLIAHQCATPRQWQASELDLLQQLAGQIAIALQQAQLFEQIQAELMERKQAEITLSKSEERWQLALQGNNDGIWDHDLITNRHFLSARCMEMLGYEFAEIDTFEKYLQYIHPDDRVRLRRTFERHLAGESSYYTCEYRIQCKNGNQKWILARGKAQWNTEGKPIRAVGSLTDITVRKQTELALKRLNQELENRVQEGTKLLKLAVSAAHLGIWQYELETGVEQWSPENYQLFGFHTDDTERVLDHQGWEISSLPTNELFLNCVYPEDRELLFQTQQEALVGRSPYKVEFRVVWPDCSIHWLQSRAVHIFNELGQPIRTIGVSMDITTHKRSEEQLRASLQEKEVLLREIHHRVKNNLQIISSLLRMQSRQSQEPETTKLLQECQDRVQSMAIIHEQLYQSPDFSQIDFGEYVQMLTNHLFRSYGVDQQTINLTIDTNGLFLTLNTAIPCGLIVNELVSNSLKHAFPNATGTVLVQLQSVLTESGSMMQLTIADTGIGIPKALDWQTNNSLGLRIVRNLAAQLRGTITLDRTYGTHFQITFPATTP